VAGQSLRVDYVRHPRARRYVLRLRPDGRVRITVPRRGSLSAAREFARSHTAWLARQLERQARRPARNPVWRPGTPVWLHGELVPLATSIDPGAPRRICFGGESLPGPADDADLRPAVERHLRQLAARELPARVRELAAREGLAVRQVSVRNQRSRWGSCSRRGTVSLNWRLVQMPPAVSDYVIWHELMHLRELNHSPRFWRHVAAVCPDFAHHRAWLRRHGEELR
jgi:predicted metal-dependent hydrolase